jgi:hypothetical protein
LAKPHDILKWVIVIVIAAMAFYVVCPKYYFSDISASNAGGSLAVGGVRCNRCTGEVILVVTNRHIRLTENTQAKGDIFDRLPPGFELETPREHATKR